MLTMPDGPGAVAHFSPAPDLSVVVEADYILGAIHTPPEITGSKFGHLGYTGSIPSPSTLYQAFRADRPLEFGGDGPYGFCADS